MEGKMARYNVLLGKDKKLDEALKAIQSEEAMKKWCKETMEKFDTNKNGVLDHEEYIEFMKYV